jgi:hypothetical protein
VQLAEDLQWPFDGRGIGEDLGLRIALVGGGDDGERADLAVLGIEHDALAERLEVFLGDRQRRMGDFEDLAVGHAAAVGDPGEVLLHVGHGHRLLGDGDDQPLRVGNRPMDGHGAETNISAAARPRRLLVGNLAVGPQQSPRPDVRLGNDRRT